MRQVVMQAIGGSTNGLIHLTAIANRTPHRIDLDMLSTRSAARCRCWSI
jgi:dihydroxyacid dehydratase/phosphogluconate dehydratase